MFRLAAINEGTDEQALLQLLQERMRRLWSASSIRTLHIDPICCIFFYARCQLRSVACRCTVAERSNGRYFPPE